jgi:HK97 family phage portal protein
MIGDLERATFSNIEHQDIAFVKHSLRPWLVRWEQALQRDLIKDHRLFAEFNIDGMARGDLKSRYAAYAVGRNWGWLSVNDIRQRENMNPIEDGNEYLRPLNMQPLGEEFRDNPGLEGEKYEG